MPPFEASSKPEFHSYIFSLPVPFPASNFLQKSQKVVLPFSLQVLLKLGGAIPAKTEDLTCKVWMIRSCTLASSGGHPDGGTSLGT